MAVTTAVMATVSTVAQIDASNRAQAASERQFQASQQKAEIQNTRSLRQQIRQARAAQATMSNVAAQAGGVGGSAVAGGTSSIASQLGGNINYMSQVAEANTAYGQAGVDVASAQADAAMWGSIGSFSGTIFNAVGGPQKVQKYLG